MKTFNTKQLKQRRIEVDNYNTLGLNNTSYIIYNTAIILNPSYLIKNKKVLSWLDKAAELFIDKLHFGEIEWNNSKLGSRWCDVELGGINTRVDFYSKKSDKCYIPNHQQFMLVLNPRSKAY